MNGVWNYQTMREHQSHPELGEYQAYGLRASRKTEYGWEQIGLLHDVTTEEQFARKLARIFTDYQLSPIHLRAVMEDMLP